MKITYGEVKIKVKAEEKDIDGPHELRLSDSFYEFRNELIEWVVEMSMRFPEFEFIVDEV